MVTFLALAGWGYNHYVQTDLPWGANKVMLSTGFFGTGFFLKSALCRREKVHAFSWARLTFAGILILFGYHIWSCNVSITMHGINIEENGNLVLFFSAAYASILAWSILAYLLGHNHILEFFGKNSLIILGIHFIILAVVRNAFLILGLSYNPYNPAWELALIAVSLIIMTPFILGINRYLSILLGKL